jgi:hypothetical protein
MVLAPDLEMIEFVCRENEQSRKRMDSSGPTLSDAPIAATTLARYAGVYDYNLFGQDHRVEITESNGALLWNQDDAGSQRLFPFTETMCSLSGTSIEFVSDSQVRARTSS